MAAAGKKLEPLFLEPRLDSRLWGGNRLAKLLGLRDPPEKLAEAWLVFDENRVKGGAFAGATLAEVARELGAGLIGTRCLERYGPQFPLLAKLIDAAGDLSIQVHPDDACAARLEGAGKFGKTEAWYVIEADDGAHFLHGFSHPIERAGFLELVAQKRVLEALRRVPARKGQMLMVPAGTVHAINRGILLFEIQQRSDLTYRIYDYDRRERDGRPRPLHLDKAVEALRFSSSTPGASASIDCEHFRMRELRLSAPAQRRTDPGTFELLAVIEGTVRLESADSTATLTPGGCAVLPAALGDYRLVPSPAALAVVCDVR